MSRGAGAPDRADGRVPAGATLSLVVAEASPRDMGRGVARLDPRDMGRLGVAVGELVAVRGRRLTAAKALPAHAEQRGKGRISIDGVTRANAQVGLDQPVEVAPMAGALAVRAALRPLAELTAAWRSANGRRLARQLQGLPVMAGDRVRLTLFGARHLEFEVVTTEPRGPVVLHARTRVTVEEGGRSSDRRGAGISYEDVGGLHREVRRLREMVELPLRHPELFERLGIDAPRGVLLHGPPGTGKTLLARAVAAETEAAFLSVSGPEIIHRYYGESEAQLRALFEEARRTAPCIVFLDEIDAIAPRRDRVQGEVEKRVVAQLLAVLDGLQPRGQVIVIAATNLPDALDPALRRPGRFDREIAIGPPDVAARREILEIHTRGMPLAADVDRDRLAAITQGFVGADLAALCREAAMATLRGRMRGTDAGESDPWVDDDESDLQVRMADFLAARAEVEPSAIRDEAVEVPEVAWDDVGGLDDVKRELREAVEWPIAHPELLHAAGVPPPRGILLHGPPGTGKTMLARALASQARVNFVSVKGPALLSKYVGESERAVRDLFRKARQAAPCVLFFDEIDALAPARSSGADDERVGGRVTAQLLTEMDGIEEREGVLVVAATNRIDRLDAALLRPGRFDLLLEVPPPDADARTRIFEVHLRGKPVAADVDPAGLAASAEGLGGAQIEMVCRRAAFAAIRRALAAESGPPPAPAITGADLVAALDEARQACDRLVRRTPP